LTIRGDERHEDENLGVRFTDQCRSPYCTFWVFLMLMPDGRLPGSPSTSRHLHEFQTWTHGLSIMSNSTIYGVPGSLPVVTWIELIENVMKVCARQDHTETLTKDVLGNRTGGNTAPKDCMMLRTPPLVHIDRQFGRDREAGRQMPKRHCSTGWRRPDTSRPLRNISTPKRVHGSTYRFRELGHEKQKSPSRCRRVVFCRRAPSGYELTCSRASFRLTNLASSSIAIPLPAFTAYFDKLDPSLSRMLRHPQSSCL
jgi:hypothetical protein